MSILPFFSLLRLQSQRDDAYTCMMHVYIYVCIYAPSKLHAAFIDSFSSQIITNYTNHICYSIYIGRWNLQQCAHWMEILHFNLQNSYVECTIVWWLSKGCIMTHHIINFSSTNLRISNFHTISTSCIHFFCRSLFLFFDAWMESASTLGDRCSLLLKFLLFFYL